MTDFDHSRKLTVVLVLWSGYVPTWAVITGSGLAMVTLWWLAGMLFFGALWVGAQPLLRQGRGFGGLSWSGLAHGRLVDGHRSPEDAERRR